jgi:hypothetical protein
MLAEDSRPNLPSNTTQGTIVTKLGIGLVMGANASSISHAKGTTVTSLLFGLNPADGDPHQTGGAHSTFRIYDIRVGRASFVSPAIPLKCTAEWKGHKVGRPHIRVPFATAKPQLGILIHLTSARSGFIMGSIRKRQ